MSCSPVRPVDASGWVNEDGVDSASQDGHWAGGSVVAQKLRKHWPAAQPVKHMYALSFIFFPMMLFHRILNTVPCAIKYVFLVYLILQ